MEALTQTYGGMVIVKLIQKRQLPDYRTFVGSGKLEEIRQIAVDATAWYWQTMSLVWLLLLGVLTFGQ